MKVIKLFDLLSQKKDNEYFRVGLTIMFCDWDEKVQW